MLPWVRLCMRSIVAGSDTCGRIGVRQAMQGDTQAHNLACKAQLTARYSAAHCSSKEPSIPKQRKTEPSQNFRVYKATRVHALQSKPRHHRCSPIPTEQMVTDRCLSSSSMCGAQQGPNGLLYGGAAKPHHEIGEALTAPTCRRERQSAYQSQPLGYLRTQ
jgi:hypothetical protein